FEVDVGDVEVAPDADAVLEATEVFVVRTCAVCGGMLKPDVVYFGENVPKPLGGEVFILVDSGAALLVAGTSLDVLRLRRFRRHPVKSGRPVIIIKQGATNSDDDATVRIHTGTTDALQAIDTALETTE